MKILFVCDAGPLVGLGHLVRSITLAKELQISIENRYRESGAISWDSFKPVFCLPMDSDEASRSRIGLADLDGWSWYAVEQQESIIRRERWDAVIFDLERGAPPDEMLWECQAAKKIGFVGAGYKNIGYEKLDLSIVQGIPNPKPPDNGKCFHGPEFVVLREEFKQEPTFDRDPSIVFVCGGGSDPLDFSYLAVQALEKCERVREIHIVLGSLYRGRLQFDQMYGEEYVVLYPREFVRVIHRDVENPYSIMSKCGLALVSFGMTAYECMAAGLPTLTLSMSEDHLASAESLENFGGLYSLGLTEQAGPYLSTHLNALFKEFSGEDFGCLSRTGRKLVDGHGAERVAAKILEIL